MSTTTAAEICMAFKMTPKKGCPLPEFVTPNAIKGTVVRKYKNSYGGWRCETVDLVGCRHNGWLTCCSSCWSEVQDQLEYEQELEGEARYENEGEAN